MSCEVQDAKLDAWPWSIWDAGEMNNQLQTRYVDFCQCEQLRGAIAPIRASVTIVS